MKLIEDLEDEDDADAIEIGAMSSEEVVISLKKWLQEYDDETLQNGLPLPFDMLTPTDTDTSKNTNCEICNEEILWRKHSAMKIVTLGMLGAVIGAFAGPIGLTAGALIGGEAGLSKRPTICDRCLDENIGNCRSCGEGMTRRSHVSNGTGTCCWADDDQ